MMFSRIILLIQPISFFAELITLVVVLFSKFDLWSFNVIKFSSLLFAWILSKISFLFAIFLPYSLIVILGLVLVIELRISCLHFSLFIL